MVELITNINSTLETCLGKGRYYGLCRLIQDDKGNIYPATYLDNKKITPDDKWPILIYHRLLNSDSVENEDLSYGRKKAILNPQRIRTIAIVNFSEDETFIDDLINALPGKIINVNYKYAELSKNISLIRDTKSIWETEWGDAYDDKYQMRFNIYALEYNLEYIKCTDCV